MQHSDSALGTERIWKLLIQMGLPGLVAQLINLLYNLVDRIYIGHIPEVGELALTGVGLTMPILQLVTAFSVLVGNGGAALAAIALGVGNRRRAENILSNGVLMLLFFSVSLTTVFFLIRRPFLYMVGASDSTYLYAEQYLVIYLTGTVFVQLSMGLNPFITAQGRARTAMCSVLIGAVINIILDPIFIFVFHMGVRGAALATVISQAASTVWVLCFLTRSSTSLRIRWKEIRPKFCIIQQVTGLGVAPFIMNSTESLIVVVLSSQLARYGSDLYVGSLTILMSVLQLIYIPMSGFTGGTSPILSYNYGAGKPERVREAFRKMLLIGGLYTVFISGMAVLFPRFFAHLFTDGAALTELVVRVLPLFICGMSIFGLQSVCMAAFIALGQAKRALVVALLRKVILLAPLAMILPALTGNVYSIYWAEPISDVTSVTVCCLIFWGFVRKGGFQAKGLPGQP